uniref:Uncharacterized protein n=1 Tax=Arundo donax TaxID=35708 RepID=A0A0A9CIU5_ARUDO
MILHRYTILLHRWFHQKLHENLLSANRHLADTKALSPGPAPLSPPIP